MTLRRVIDKDYTHDRYTLKIHENAQYKYYTCNSHEVAIVMLYDNNMDGLV